MAKPFYPCDFYNDGAYMIRYSDEVYASIGWIESSYNVVPARIMGLSFPSFLRFARDRYNAVLGGQSQKYVTMTFKDKKDCQNLCDILNKRWREVMN